MSRNRLIGPIGVAALIAGTLVVSPVAAQAADPQTIQVLGINDFHGRLVKGTTNGEAGAAVLSGAVNQLRAQYPETVFAAAGDLIGASTFDSFINEDKPTIDALNEAGLDVSAVGNHEFDQGYADLVDRVMAPYDATTNPLGGAEWGYLGANVRNKVDNSAALPEAWIADFGEVQVGFVGAVTDHLPELVSPAGIEDLTIESPVVAANREADKLKAAGAEVVVLLVHEGAATTALASATDPASDFGKIVNGVNANVDAIISGHTHLTYNHLIPVPQWQQQGRPVTARPVVSAGQYGLNLDQLLFSVDPDTGVLLGVQSNTLPLAASTAPYPANYPADPQTAGIVAAAVARAEVLGAVELGQIQGPFKRAYLANGTTENRGGESTLGNLVAEVQRWATPDIGAGPAQIALMNPGGLRADMVGNVTPSAPVYPAEVTYRQAANTQPFANTLVNMTLTGAQLKAALEQQWQPAGAQRPFLRLGLSEGFTYTYDPNGTPGSRITDMWLNGARIDPAQGYSVTVNSFLAAGGDNFTVLASGTNRRDTGQADLQAMVDYLAAKTPLVVDDTQRSVGVTFPDGAPTSYARGETVEFSLSSLAFSTAADRKDGAVAVKVGDVAVGEFAVDNTIGTEIFDEYGKAQVKFTLPANVPWGSQTVTITGTTTGTTTTVPLEIATPVTTVTLTPPTSSQIYGSPNTVTLTAGVTSSTGTPVTGSVDFVAGSTALGTAQIQNGQATFTLPASTEAGTLSVVARFAGSADTPAADSPPVTVTVQQATSAAILLATKNNYRQNPLFPAFLIGAVALNNGQLAQGKVQIVQDGKVVATVATSYGIFLWTVPRNLKKGAYTFQASYLPTDSANVLGVDSNETAIQIR